MENHKLSIAEPKPAKHESEHEQNPPPEKQSEVNSIPTKVCVCTKCKCNKGSQND